MNKKFSTLMALALLAGSFPVAAQYCPQDGEVPYRTRFVKAADLDATFQNVSKINQEYYYQLEVEPSTLPFQKQDKDFRDAKNYRYVLSVERDYSTGKLYLTAQKVTNATLTHTLWKIKVTERSANGRVYSFENKETGFDLTFDHLNALQIDAEDGDGIVVPGSYDEKDVNKANYGWNYLEDGLNDGCNSNWAWYTTDEVNGDSFLNYKKVFSYFHNQSDSVMTLIAVANSIDPTNNLGKNLVYNTSQIRSLSDNQGNISINSYDGLNGTVAGGFAIVAVKDAKAPADDFIKGVGATPLKIRPVVAGAKVLNAAEINSMIDADGSWLNFDTEQNDFIKFYGDKGWNDADNKNDKNHEIAKFTVLKPGTNEPLNVVEGANPFAHAFTDGKFVAESFYSRLNRDEYKNDEDHYINEDGSVFAGYDILLRTKDAIQQVGNEKQFGYLYVSEHTYEPKTATSNHDGLQVKIQPYSYLSKGVDGGDRMIVKEIDKDAAYITDGYPDALEARYHWKVTYYATNDSLVLEPLNASRMNTKEMAAETPFEKTHLATQGSEKWVNTVNEATPYDNSNTSTDGNWMSAKKAGVPVALFAMNNSQVGDEAQLLTIGTPKNAEAADANYAALCKGDGNPAYVTNNKVEKISPYQADMNLRLKFNHGYAHLTRATMASGVYFMNLATNKFSTAQTEHRVNGANLVADMGGHVVYDVEEQGQQDFNHMPATQWVVETQPCLTGDELNYNENPTVCIYNREYGDLRKDPFFAGQLYTAGDGKFFTINHREYGWLAKGGQQNVDKHKRYVYNCADTVTFAPVDVNELGYFNETDENLRNTTYMFQHMYDMNAGKFLTVSDKNNNLRVGDTGTSFELFRSEGWVPVPDSTKLYNPETGKWDIDAETGTYHFDYVKEQKYGYASEAANATQLYKTFYKIKVKDANLIDNDHKFVAINNQYKYVVATEDEIMDPKNHLSFAIVSLKENNHLNDIHGYAIVNNPTYIKVNAKTDADLKDLYPNPYSDEFGNEYVEYFRDADGDKKYDASKGDKIMVRMVKEGDENNYQVTGKLGVEAVSLDTKIDELCNTSTDAFALVSADRPLYATIASEYVNNDKKALDIYTIERQGNESLFEDSSSKEAQRWGMNYLGAENMNKPTKNEGFYVDAVAKSMGTRMPQYLFVVAADSVPAYEYCDCGIDGHAQHGINSGCGHSEKFAGYVDGRFMINYNDSVQAAMIDKVTNADKFKSDNYTRLGFVEAVHRGDSLYVLKYPYTLESIKAEAKDGSGKYIIPTFLSKDSLGKVYDIVPLDGKHNNAVFSFRNTGDTEGVNGESSFLIESNDRANVDGKPASYYSGVGSFAGAWIKIHNNVPVLAKYYSNDGNHNTGDFTDDWVAVGDKTEENVTGEFINQGARFIFKDIDKDSGATANEEITAEGNVIVAGANGAVVVKGAEGKNVIVSTILGKVVANEVVSSDNATIAAPQGVVVVSVDGESFKVVVK
ncbi:uncharacterized protein BN646_02106 [Parabacteroides sp. CAG:409]|nr:uncharacterized protein BN646_02106 [Parabacteroides sp. CAG:409]